MIAEFAHHRAQSLLKQRNMLLVMCVSLVVLLMLMTLAVLKKDREIVLQPILSKPMAITSGEMSAAYLEAATRDTALILLNRTPTGLDYWMEQVLKIVDTNSYGRVKRDLVDIVSEQRNSDTTQAFAMTGMRVDPDKLVSEVDGIVSTYVGTKVISTQKRTFRFVWSYQGVSLSLKGFDVVRPDETPKRTFR